LSFVLSTCSYSWPTNRDVVPYHDSELNVIVNILTQCYQTITYIDGEPGNVQDTNYVNRNKKICW